MASINSIAHPTATAIRFTLPSQSGSRYLIAVHVRHAEVFSSTVKAVHKQAGIIPIFKLFVTMASGC
jgi:hypothetical protein